VCVIRVYVAVPLWHAYCCGAVLVLVQPLFSFQLLTVHLASAMCLLATVGLYARLHV
jgi:hypothetical protein